mgnify:CR=1 FL=1
MNSFDFIKEESSLIDFVINNNYIDDRIIKLFNLFLCSNPHYLYNKTYVTDLIPKFIENINILRDKKNECYNIVNKLRKFNNDKFFILVDNYFIIIPDNNKSVVSYYELYNDILDEKLNDNSNKINEIKTIISSYSQCLNLFNIDKEKMKLRIFFNKNDFIFVINNNSKKKDIDNLKIEIDIFIKECLKYGESNKYE